MHGTDVKIPVGGAIEATGFFVTTLQVSRPKDAPPLEIWITYSRATDSPCSINSKLQLFQGANSRDQGGESTPALNRTALR